MPKRLIKFLRSILPADPYQLLFLAGIVCLCTVHGVRWWHPSAHTSPGREANSFGQFLVNGGTVVFLPIIFAQVTGWFVCFWPGKHPVRRTFALVVFPVVVSIFLVFGSFIYLAGPSSSVLQGAAVTTASKLKWIQTIALESVGLRLTLIALFLITLFVLRLALGASSLPFRLSSSGAEDCSEVSGWRRILILIWFLIALQPLLEGLSTVLAVSVLPTLARKPWFVPALMNAFTIGAFAIAILIADPKARKTIRESISVPKYKWTGFALFFPIAVDLLLSVAERNSSVLRRTSVASNTTPGDFASTFFWLLLPAFFEEVVFRGLLQKRFIRRYGMYRGIFLVGVAWAAFHVHVDFAFNDDSYVQVFERLTGRTVMTLAIGFVLSWLTLKSRTVVPATICHALYNALIYAPPHVVFRQMSNVRIVLWALAAIVLFRFWPVSTDPGSGAFSPPQDATPQTRPSDSSPPPSASDPSPITA